VNLQVAVLAGGLSPERDVSLRSGRRVAEALRESAPDWEVTEWDVDGRLLGCLAEHCPDAVIPLLHGAAGEDGALRDVLASLELPFVGSSARSARLAFDKPIAKALVDGAEMRTPAALALPQSTFRELGAAEVLQAVAGHLGLPVVVKPTRGGSALGTSIVRYQDEFPGAMVSSFAYADVALIERFVDGTELAVCVLDEGDGPTVLPPVEIVPPNGLYDYHARYTAGTTEFFIPARLADHVLAAAADLALRVHTVLGLRDWSRTDLIVDHAGTPWFLEVNVAPGMTETSLFPQSLTAAGHSVGKAMRRLVEQAVRRAAG
jgi:D-alanine-D-alanine ligase